MQRSKRSRIRAAKVTAGHGSKKKNRGAGHRGGRGKAGSGKRGDAKLMKVTSGRKYLGKSGFTSLKKEVKAINLQELQAKSTGWLQKGIIQKKQDVFEVDLGKLGYQKLLSKGAVLHKFSITVDSATEAAAKKIEAAGGQLERRK